MAMLKAERGRILGFHGGGARAERRAEQVVAGHLHWLRWMDVLIEPCREMEMRGMRMEILVRLSMQANQAQTGLVNVREALEYFPQPRYY
jgi:hypothetical protein